MAALIDVRLHFPIVLGRKTPHSAGKLSTGIVYGMKMKQKELTLRDLRMAAYQVWGERLAGKMVQLAISSGLVELSVLPRILGTSIRRRLVSTRQLAR